MIRFCIKTIFFIFFCHKRKKVRKKKEKPNIFHRSQPALGHQPAFISNNKTLVDPPFCMFFSYLLHFPFFFLLVMEKDLKKLVYNAESNDFDQQTACKAPVRWSKYKTHSKKLSRINLFCLFTVFKHKTILATKFLCRTKDQQDRLKTCVWDCA